VLRFWDTLSGEESARFLEELERLDLALLDRVLRDVLPERPSRSSRALEPPEVFALRRDPSLEERARRARALGASLLARGAIACLTVAGGQATRLGADAPKGTLPIGPVSRRSLFRIHADKIAGARRRYRASIPWYVLTSEANHEATIVAFRSEGFFGLPEEDVRIFRQGSVAAVDPGGRILLAERGRILTSPDGHGGVFAALASQRILEDARARGVEHFSYFQVDNPLVPPADPLFVGLHVEALSDFSCKVVEKRDPEEKVGLLVREEGKLVCIEYSDLEPALARARDPSGRLRFSAGNIAMHLLRLEFVEERAADALGLPFHRARKRVRAVGESGAIEEVNAVKFERFVFDALPMARNVLLLEVAREEEFSPVKNASGDNSPATARAAMALQAARWFEAAGLRAPPPGPEGWPPVEIGGRFACDFEEFAERARSLRGFDSPVFLDEGGPIR
jgi:UDP-N-acetylglucosamine/UDP-N-acetylgalactosamine diphosphorylase